MSIVLDSRKSIVWVFEEIKSVSGNVEVSGTGSMEGKIVSYVITADCRVGTLQGSKLVPPLAGV